ncbi:MAG: hypothetical protein HZC50_03995 [Nitrospirae bacterium]|nr:hypothetical protein [Nitrospirota bacterium]
MKYPVSLSLRHKGKVVELDAVREMVVLLGVNGEAIGTLSWDFVIDQILAYRKRNPRNGCRQKEPSPGFVQKLINIHSVLEWGYGSRR